MQRWRYRPARVALPLRSLVFKRELPLDKTICGLFARHVFTQPQENAVARIWPKQRSSSTEYIDTAEIRKSIANAGSFKGCRVK
jgi:hypothetical protein